jgi:uncharacterized protein
MASISRSAALVTYPKKGFAMLLDDLLAMKPALESPVSQCGAKQLRVFGSVARRTERPDSDVDFLVDLPRGYDLFGQRRALEQE